MNKRNTTPSSRHKLFSWQLGLLDPKRLREPRANLLSDHDRGYVRARRGDLGHHGGIGHHESLYPMRSAGCVDHRPALRIGSHAAGAAWDPILRAGRWSTQPAERIG